MQAFQDTLVIVLDTVVIVSLYPFTLPDPYHVPLEESCNLCPLSSFTCHPTHARQTTKYNSSGSFGGASLARGGFLWQTQRTLRPSSRQTALGVLLRRASAARRRRLQSDLTSKKAGFAKIHHIYHYASTTGNLLARSASLAWLIIACSISCRSIWSDFFFAR